MRDDRQDSDIGLTAGRNLELAARFLKALYEENEDKNVLISPINLHYALSILYLGSSGQSRIEFRSLLGGGGKTDEYFHQANKALIEREKKSLENMSLYNEIAFSDGLSIVPEFRTGATNMYSADFKKISANGEGKRGAIKGADSKRVSITTLLSFSQAWRYAFEKKGTLERMFARSATDSIATPFMRSSRTVENEEVIGVYNSIGFLALSIPLKGEGMKMVMVLPKDGYGIANTIDSVRAWNWKSPDSRFRREKVRLYFPKLSLKTHFQLNSQLRKSGLLSPFLPSDSDFANMFTPSTGVSIKSVVHDVSLSVDENGAGFVSKTVSIISDTAPLEVSFNRPFLILAYSEESKCIYLFGVITNPREAAP
jgi:serpin B